MLHASRFPHGSPGLVPHPQQDPDADEAQNLHCDAEEHHGHSERVHRRLLRLEEERADEVAQAVADEQHRVGRDLLRVARRVRRRDGHTQRPGRRVGEGNPEACKSPVWDGLVDEPQAEDSRQEGNETDEHDEQARIRES